MPTAQEILRQYWGYPAFRAGQQDIIEAVDAGRDVLALLPTGGGKSLCYQVPALMRDGLCLVVSPLISLMQDQVRQLKQRDIMAEAIYAGMHYNDVKRTLENMRYGPYKLLYVSPERLQTDLFREYLPTFNLNMIAVDEAHCVSQWGHDFRPDYLKIAELREIFDDIPFLALTASAPEHVQNDIAQQLKLKQPLLFAQSFERKNIFYNVQYTENKNAALLQQLEEVKGTAIIYCRSRRQTEVTTRYLQQHGRQALSYHAGMPREKRTENQQTWTNSNNTIIVATTAFGMGIDKPDVRLVVHYDAPEYLEGYYQESGRGGRDGKSALSALLYNNVDMNRLHDSIALNFPPEEYLRRVYQSVVEYLQVPIGMQPDRYFDFDIQDFSKKFELDALPATRALKILEQEGLWTMTDAVYNPATVIFTIDRRGLDAVMQAHPPLAMLCTTLLRLHGNILHSPVAINTLVLAKHIKMQKEDVGRMLQQLHAMEVIEYYQPRMGPQLFFHHYRVDSRHLIINMQRIGVLKRQHEQRIAGVQQYLANKDVCRNKLLLQYFDEIAADYCGHCDVCLRNKKQSPSETDLLKHMSNQPLPVQLVIDKYPMAIRQAVLALIRKMADERKIKLHPDGSVSVISAD
ncbi:MAG: RecQ family ATP-dependent DNA helicase [Sphingobacteriales bacterium]|nr:MAG: RecQ family ATP-dependent DNA helicase [Sphingobacteriales bacterium]